MSGNPPPGYNAGESMLQGGTTPIVSVMGGGRVMAAMKGLRKKRSRKQRRTRATRGTKKARRKRIEQEGGNHYDLEHATNYLHNNSHTLYTADVETKTAPTENPLNESPPGSVPLLTPYLRDTNRQWVRKISTPLFGYSELKSNIPTSDNIGLSTGVTQAALKIVKYAPDRLCRILSKDTSAIVLLPAVRGELQLFYRIATSIRTNMQAGGDIRRRVYIFSPPFFGQNHDANVKLYALFLTYKTSVFPNDPSPSIKTWEMYLLPEYSTQNIQASLAVSKTLQGDLKSKIPEIDSLPLKSLPDESKATYVGPMIKNSIFPMLEPTYIIYPYTLEFSATPTGPTVGSALDTYKARVASIDQTVAQKTAALAAARQEQAVADSRANAAKTEVWNAQQKVNASRSAFARLNTEQEQRKAELTGATLALKGIAQSDRQFAAATASVKMLSDAIDAAAAELANAKAANDGDVAAFKLFNSKATSANNTLTAANKKLDQAQKAVANAERVAGRDKAALGPPPQPPLQAVQEEKGGLLFSAALVTEPSLPAAYSGFQGPIQYIQRTDASADRRSIAYRADTATRDRDLDTMDYKEYALLIAPPMGPQEICTITLKPPSSSGEIRMSDTMESFLGSPDAVQTHVPNVHISVGAIDYSIRSPVPDVVDDWKNGIFSDDEAGYLTAMKFTPRILQDSRVFGTNWKIELANHLSMITRSNCFKDSRLLLHADCQDAQKFVSKVLEYYMNNSDLILQLQQKGDDSFAKSLQKQLEAQIAARGSSTGTSEDIFNPDSFVKAFFLPKNTTRATAPAEFITSVSPILLDKILTSFNVEYSETLTLDMKQNIETNVADTFTVTPSSTPGKYKWAFLKPHGLNEIITQTRRHIPSFRCPEPYSKTASVVSEINVIYRGTLSVKDKKLLVDKLGSDFTEKESILNTYTWTFKKPFQRSPQDIVAIIKPISNSNKHIFALTLNNDPDAKVTELLPKLDIKTNRITKTFLGSMGAGYPGKKIQYIDLSMAFDTGLSNADSYKEIDDKYKAMAKLINARKDDPDYDPNFLFRDKYVFQA